ncbi:MAG: zinc metallopeptidase [Gammaproteobacteria bacterium]|nr:zinc metallopeptidase [Gammaproteobacteria bacterium]MCW8972188.1 zinc metallopeptidase [Gammaproteobacteria bacterium]MCW8991838.1 zinc metallopeptidase [Gammaproteobacteria bacterium]
MPYIILLILLLAVVFGPQWWAQWTFRRYAAEREDLPGSGAELASHLLDKMNISDVGVEQTDRGDHYDPEAKMVRLSAENHNGRSLTAVAVAAHEVGHAIQHHRKERMLERRTRLVRSAQWAQKIGAAMMFAIPVITAITKMPQSGLLLFLVGLGSMAMATVVHLITLPVEMDASFNKALPLISHGRYINHRDQRAVKRILRAAALTYVAASLASLLNLARWFRFFRC